MKKIFGAVVILLTVVGLAQGVKKTDPRMGLAFLVHGFDKPNKTKQSISYYYLLKRLKNNQFGNTRNLNEHPMINQFCNYQISSAALKNCKSSAIYNAFGDMPPAFFVKQSAPNGVPSELPKDGPNNSLVKRFVLRGDKLLENPSRKK
jgi:hypothetical protein